MTDAYGKASDIPMLLEQLESAALSSDPQSEPWFSLWSALCHQSDVYDATYAAIPHIVAIAASKPKEERLGFINFISVAEAYRHKRNSPAIPDDLQLAYYSALKKSVPLILECLERDWDEEGYKVLLAALAVLWGKYKLGVAIFEMEEKVVCPECDSIFVARGYDTFDEI